MAEQADAFSEVAHEVRIPELGRTEFGAIPPTVIVRSAALDRRRLTWIMARAGPIGKH